jgi:enoyl-CoA hydratase
MGVKQKRRQRMRFVQFEINGPVCTITMNQLQQAKRCSPAHGPGACAMPFCGLSAMKHHVAVLTGNAGHFCAGADLAAVADPGLRNELDSKAAEVAPWVRHGLN